MTRLLSAVIVLALAGSGFAEEKVKPTAEKLAGTWKLVKSGNELPPGAEALLIIDKDGTFSMKVSIKDQKIEMSGKWKLDGNKLNVEYTDGEEKGRKETMEITKLTADEFVTVDEKKKTDEFKRVKAK